MPGCPIMIKKIFTRTALLLIAFILGISASGLTHLEVQANPGPDLIVQDITLSPEEPLIGDIVTITVNVKNQGTHEAGNSHVACHIDDTVLASEYISSIDAGTIRTIAFTWTAQAGSHIVKAIADSSEMVAEDDETNNAKTFNFTTLAADLVIQSITWTPENPSKGDSIIFSVTVNNQGSSKSRATNVILYIDGNSKGYQDFNGINPGSTVTKTYNWIASPGQHAIKAVADETDLALESDETNNTYMLTFSTLPPDLIVQEITWSPENLSRNDVVTMTTTIKNQGNGRADSCFLGYYIDQELHSAVQVSSLAADTSTNITFSLTMVSDTHTFRAVIDLYQDVVESDESNNEKTVNLMTIAPDLVVEDITWSPENAAVGYAVTFTATIKNQGAGKAAASRVDYYINGTHWGYTSLQALNAGAESTVTFQWPATLDINILTVKVVADSTNTLAETYEHNNVLIKTIPLVLPDLLIPDITWSPENPDIGESVTFTVTVANQGGGKAKIFHVGFYIDDVLLDSDPIYTAESSASTNRTYSWQAQKGIHTFKAMADCNRLISESNEENNERVVTIIPNIPDLTIGTITWSPPDMVTGSEITFDIDIKNMGSLRSSPARIAFYIDGVIVGYADIGQIDTGATVTAHFIWMATAGSHTIDIVADANNQILEIDETNNSKVVNIPPPDLVIHDITWAPEDISIGDTVTFTATLKNQGSSKTTASQVICYVDGVLIGSQDLPEIDAAASMTSLFDWVAEAGTHSIRIIVDSNNQVTETDETNNERETDFSTRTPDLTIEAISWSMENSLIDNEATFVVTVKNQGSDETAISQLTYYIDDISVASQDMEAVEAGETATVTFLVTIEAGEHTFKIIADSENQVIEIDETNNEDELVFSTMVPDLVLKNITWSPISAAAGDTVTITVKIENRGRDTALNHRLDLQVDGTSLGYVDIEEIAAGAIITRDFTWIAVEGAHEIGAFVDIDEMILENNEANNIKSRTVTFAAPEPPAINPVILPSTSAPGGGFLSDSWWLIALVAALFGGTAFIIALRSFKKD